MTATAPATAAHDLPPQPRRRWWQFSLRTLLLVMLVLGVLFGLFAIRLERARRQAAAVATIREVGGEVYYDYEHRFSAEYPGVPSKVPKWILASLGPDFFHEVVEVVLGPAAMPTPSENVDRCWAAISQLYRVEGIQAYGEWIDDSATASIRKHGRLRRLVLEDGSLSDNELEALGESALSDKTL